MIAGTVWDAETRRWMTLEDWVALNRVRDDQQQLAEVKQGPW